MLRCNNCQHLNPSGSIFCIECGAQLIAVEITTQNIRTDQVRATLGTDMPHVDPPPAFREVDAWGSLHLMDNGQILPLSTRNEFLLGRISEGQPVMPDIDLTPYNAYANGVSRLHAMIRRDGKRVILMDLGSANGSYVNGKRLTPNMERLLNHGDVIVLGKLKFQILIS
jgi:FHA domain/Double zinc ribbon